MSASALVSRPGKAALAAALVAAGLLAWHGTCHAGPVSFSGTDGTRSATVCAAGSSG